MEEEIRKEAEKCFKRRLECRSSEAKWSKSRHSPKKNVGWNKKAETVRPMRWYDNWMQIPSLAFFFLLFLIGRNIQYNSAVTDGLKLPSSQQPRNKFVTNESAELASSSSSSFFFSPRWMRKQNLFDFICETNFDLARPSTHRDASAVAKTFTTMWPGFVSVKGF